MSKFAVIETGGKQYKVSAGDKIKVEKLAGVAGADLVFDKVLLVADGDKVEVGDPYVAGAKVVTTVARQMRDKKKIIFKYHSKTRYRRKKGHRQELTEVTVVSV